jgi:hypothetical protein
MRRGAGWMGLVLAPLLALSDQGVAYALAGWSCAHQQAVLPHVAHAAFLAAIVAMILLDWPAARAGLHGPREQAGFSTQRHGFVAVAAVALGALSAAIVVAMWIPQWVLSPCFA